MKNSNERRWYEFRTCNYQEVQSITSDYFASEQLLSHCFVAWKLKLIAC